MLRLFNTLTGKKEKFKPIKKGEVKMYSCGPTVYNYAHIGNLRAYVFTDILRRVLEYLGLAVRHVMNITDVGHLSGDSDEGEDKMVRALKRDGKPLTLAAMREVSEFYADAFKKDLAALDIELPKEMPFASEHIKEDIELIKELEKKGFTYQAGQGIYFDTSKFPEYGKLGSVNIEGLKAGARAAVNTGKRNPIDFTLWKVSENDIGWNSPWGKGFPGWHIECSAMGRAYLGQPFDIHTGGIDHIPTHHQNEIAQSEAAYDRPLAHYFVHNEHLIVPSAPALARGFGEVKKMAKSEGNVFYLKTLIDEGIKPLAFRYYLLMTHYRSPVSFTLEALRAAQNSYFKLLRQFANLPKASKAVDSYMRKFEESISDDLNTAIALSIVWEMLKDASLNGADKKATLLEFDRVLGLDLGAQGRQLKAEMAAVPESIKKLANEREKERQARNWNRADEIRQEIQRAGFEIMDTEDGPLLRKTLR